MQNSRDLILGDPARQVAAMRNMQVQAKTLKAMVALAQAVQKAKLHVNPQYIGSRTVGMKGNPFTGANQ